MIGSKLLRQSIKCSQKLLPPVTLSNLLTQVLKPGRRRMVALNKGDKPFNNYSSSPNGLDFNHFLPPKSRRFSLLVGYNI